ncbi:MAG: hypothetical protein LBP36_01335 [Oscillospiraceae bacterium]|nr:hypothetical protein [Oscillospiraceae bacterium]
MTEERIKEIFIKSFNKIVENKAQIIKDCKILLLEACDGSKIENEIKKTQTEIQNITNLIESMTDKECKNGTKSGRIQKKL